MTARAPVTRIGLQVPSFVYPDAPDNELFERVAETAVTAEASGFDSLWVGDHFQSNPYVGNATDPTPEAYTLLGGIAARTRAISLGVLVSGVTYRNPALLAKTVTTLDVVSAGRAILGLGAAWFEQEHSAYGFEFPPLRERFERLEEALAICRAMLRDQLATVAGRHHSVSGALNHPRPLRPGGIPILVGGSGERQTLRLVALYADACNLHGDVATIEHKLSVLDRWCDEAGRDRGEITVTRIGTLVTAPTAAEAERSARALRADSGLDQELFRAAVTVGDANQVAEQLDEYVAAGVDGVIFNLPDVHDPERVAIAGEALARTALGNR